MINVKRLSIVFMLGCTTLLSHDALLPTEEVSEHDEWDVHRLYENKPACIEQDAQPERSFWDKPIVYAVLCSAVCSLLAHMSCKWREQKLQSTIDRLSTQCNTLDTQVCALSSAYKKLCDDCGTKFVDHERRVEERFVRNDEFLRAYCATATNSYQELDTDVRRMQSALGEMQGNITQHADAINALPDQLLYHISEQVVSREGFVKFHNELLTVLGVLADDIETQARLSKLFKKQGLQRYLLFYNSTKKGMPWTSQPYSTMLMNSAKGLNEKLRKD